MNSPATQLASIFDLSSYEASLYISALDLSQATITSLASRAGIPRTAAYLPLKQLVAKGFLSPLRAKGKRTLYRALEPQHLIHIFQQRKLNLEEFVGQFAQSLSSGSGELWVRYFEGRTGLELAADIFLSESNCNLWKTFENAANVEKIIGASRFDKYVRRRVEKGVRGRVILPAQELTPWIKTLIEEQEKNLTEYRFVSPEIYPLEATLAVGGEWVFVEAAIKKPFALLIKNAPLARTIESIHDMAWDRFKT